MFHKIERRIQVRLDLWWNTVKVGGPPQAIPLRSTRSSIFKVLLSKHFYRYGVEPLKESFASSPEDVCEPKNADPEGVKQSFWTKKMAKKTKGFDSL